MIDDLVILPIAEQDIAQAFAWYERREPGLGDELLACIEDCYLAIRRTPEAFRAVRRDYRRALVQRFPYSVFYKFDGETIVVHALFHNSRDPRKWSSRLR